MPYKKVNSKYINTNLWGVIMAKKHAWGKTLFTLSFLFLKRKSSNVRHLEAIPMQCGRKDKAALL